MSHPTSPRPLDPYVERNPFRQRTWHAPRIKTFADIKQKLPQPVLPSHPQWVEMYWRAWEMAWGNLCRPGTQSGLVANFISPAANEHIFMWDSAFMMLFGLYGRRAFYFMGSLDNFYAKQHRDGFICREIDWEEGYDFYQRFDPNSTGPNILAWAEWLYFRATGDKGRLEDVFFPLLAYHRWLCDHRTWRNGLYWATGESSGMSNQTRIPHSENHHQHWAWIDTTAQAVLNCEVLGKMAAEIGETEHIEALAGERLRLIERMNSQMWDANAEFYKDIDRDGLFSDVKSVGAYWALLASDLVPEKRVLPFIQHLREPAEFKRQHRVPTQAADSTGYHEGGDYWRGGVWSSTNYMVLRGLHLAGQNKLAHEIAINHLENVAEVFAHTDTFWENYAPEAATAGSQAGSNFVGWTGLSPISMLLENVIGIRADWVLRRVTWDRRLQTDAVYGVLNYPLGGEGTMDLTGDVEQIVVKTDVPFTLVIEGAEGRMQVGVNAGISEIPLV